MAAALTAGISVGSTGRCCEGDKPSPPPSCLSRVIEIVGRVALTVFAFVLAPMFMLMTHTIGILCGMGYALIQDLRKKVQFRGEFLKPVCAQGYLERLSGKKWPVPVTQIVTDFFIGLHTFHDPKIFGPIFCGLFTGFWAGRLMTNSLINLSQRSWKKEPPSLVPVTCCCSGSW